MTPEAPTPLFCKDCAHLIGKRHLPEHAAGWKCGAPQNIRGRTTNFVTGEQINSYMYPDCVSARSQHLALSTSPIHGLQVCGPAGLWFEQYIHPEHVLANGCSQTRKPSADDLLNELGELK